MNQICHIFVSNFKQKIIMKYLNLFFHYSWIVIKFILKVIIMTLIIGTIRYIWHKRHHD